MWRPRAARAIPEPRASRRTLDRKHQDKLSTIADAENSIEQWKQEVAALESVERTAAVSTQIATLRRQIDAASTARREYYLDNSRELFEYFEERQQDAEPGQGTASAKAEAFFFGRRHGTTKKEGAAERYRAATEVEDMLANMSVNRDFRCQCGGEMVPIESEGMRTCKACGLSRPFMSENDRLTYKEPPKEVTFYSYKRINHFREIVAQFQAKQSTTIPPDLLDSVRSQLRKERRRPQDLTVGECKELLKKLGFNKYYEHIAFIWDKLGVKPPVMSPALETRLFSLFCDVEKRYAMHCPDDRVNFLHYYYVLYKLCELLGERSYLEKILMLKDPARKAEQDVVWRKICNDLEWPFYPTA